jgi:hypothetical protein
MQGWAYQNTLKSLSCICAFSANNGQSL